MLRQTGKNTDQNRRRVVPVENIKNQQINANTVDKPNATINILDIAKVFNSYHAIRFAIMIIQKMDPLTLAEFCLTCRDVDTFLHAHGKNIGIKFKGDIIIGRMKKKTLNDPNVYVKIAKRNSDFYYYFDVRRKWGMLNCWCPSSLTIEAYSKDDPDYSEEHREAIEQFLRGRKFYEHRVYLTENDQFDNFTKPNILHTSRVPEKFHPNVQLLYFNFERRKLSFQDWQQCREVQWVQAIFEKIGRRGSVFSTTAKALVETWKENRLGRLNIIEFVFNDHQIVYPSGGYERIINDFMDELIVRVNLTGSRSLIRLLKTIKDGGSQTRTRKNGVTETLALKQVFEHENRKLTLVLHLTGSGCMKTRKFEVVARFYPNYSALVPFRTISLQQSLNYLHQEDYF